MSSPEQSDCSWETVETLTNEPVATEPINANDAPSSVDIVPRPSLARLGVLRCDICEYTTTDAAKFQIHLLIKDHADKFEKHDQVLYCTFCKHYSAHRHNFRTHICSKKHMKKLTAFKNKFYKI